jgi:hypothetical protein
VVLIHLFLLLKEVSFKNPMRNLLLILSFSAVWGCAHSPHLRQDFPSKGWSQEYDQYIQEHLSESLLTVPASRMVHFCPSWEKLSRRQRAQFYSDLFYSVASAESDFNSASMYVEDKLGTDPVTGEPVVSEGLFQLSYQDVRRYGAPCDFHFSQDREKFLEDLRGKTRGSLIAKHRDREILNPYRGLSCALAITEQRLRESPKSFDLAMAAYWSTLNPKHTEKRQTILVGLRTRSSPCLERD